MKIRTAIVLSCLVGVVIFSMGAECRKTDGNDAPAPASAGVNLSPQKQAASAASKIGVVSIRKIFQDCRKNARYRQEATAEQDRVMAELDKLKAEFEAAEAGLKTLKRGSGDHLALMQEILEKKAGLQAKQQFHEQQMELKYQRWIEELYKDILRQTRKIAEQKGLDLVFEKDEIDFPALSVNDVMMSIRTHKLLYSGGCLDVTDDVIALLDAEESEDR